MHMTQWYPSRSRIRRRWLGVTFAISVSVPQGVDTLIGWVYLEGSESEREEEQDGNGKGGASLPLKPQQINRRRRYRHDTV